MPKDHGLAALFTMRVRRKAAGILTFYPKKDGWGFWFSLLRILMLFAKPQLVFPSHTPLSTIAFMSSFHAVWLLFIPPACKFQEAGVILSLLIMLSPGLSQFLLGVAGWPEVCTHLGRSHMARSSVVGLQFHKLPNLWFWESWNFCVFNY